MLKCCFFFLLIFVDISSFPQTYITHVTVLDVLHKKTLQDQTVSFSDNLITAVQSSGKIKIPADAAVIDGTGKYLMPGLTDAHVHFFQSGGLYTRPDALDLQKLRPYKNEIDWVHANMEDFLRRYVCNGITSVYDVGATFSFLKQRDSFVNKTYAPHIFMTGPLITSYEPPVFKNLGNDEPFTYVKTPEEGIKAVQAELPFHPDFIKVWYIVNSDSVETSARKFLPIFKAIVDEAHKNNLAVAVHATERITAQLAAENGCDYLVHDVEDEVVNDDFIQLLKTKHVILCPTLIVADGYDKTFGQNMNYSFYELANANPEQMGTITDIKHLPASYNMNRYKTYMNGAYAIQRSATADSIRMVNLKKMADAGVTIAAGTDAGNIGTQHASSFYTEMEAMQQSGLTNWQIIQSATINGAKILHKEDSLGSITAGKKADMVLLDANPLNSLSNIIKINVVINKGIVIKPGTHIKETPLALVQRQLNAYNQRNIDAFLEPYADSVKLYQFPDTLIAKGKEAMRKEYDAWFKQTPNLHCEIKSRIIKDNMIIDEESVSDIEKNDVSGIAIYIIEDNKIAKVYFK